MQQTQDQVGKPKHSSHMSKRPPRLANSMGTPEQPHMHAEQRPSEYDVSEWGDWVSSEGGVTDPLYVPPEVKRVGFAYQWIATSVLNSEDAIVKRRVMTFMRSGWRPVPGERGRGYFFLDGENVPANIVLGGQMLVEKPKHIEEHARKLNERAAKEQLHNKLEEVGMAAPENVRQKLVSHKIDPNGDAIQTVAPNSVPD